MSTLFSIAYKLCVFFLGFTFFTAGMGKLYAGHQFFGFMGPVWLAERLAEYDLKLFADFVGFSQVVIGFTMLTYKFRHLASVMLIPMIANILMITISQNWKGTPYVVSVFLAMNVFVLIFDRHQYLHLFGVNVLEKRTPLQISIKGATLWLLGLLFVLVSIPVSFYLVQVSWILTLMGIVLSTWSNWIDKQKEKRNLQPND